MKYISYIRVSTKKQGASGLGIEAQRFAIQQFVASKGGEIIQEYVEVKSGTSRKRKLIKEAVLLSNSEKATLIVAKLDRLARDTEYAHHIRNTAHNITAVDMPDMNKMMFGIFCLMSEYERDLISQRTKAALQAKRRTGWEPKHKRFNVGNTGGAVERWDDKQKYPYSLISTVKSLRQTMTLREVARELNNNGEKTITGAKWSAVQIQRICQEKN